MVFVLPSLDYDYDYLEPFFDEKTMKIHHTKHHQAYIDNANIALADLPDFNKLSITDLVQKIKFLPKDKQDTLRNNAGGHINHSMFWKFLKHGTILQGVLKSTIENCFSSVYNFKKEFEKVATSRFGSGWVWLVKQDHSLKIVSTANQDNPLMGSGLTGVSGDPILGLDVWEHAYYLKYQNRRLDYVQNFWNVINWDEVSIRFAQ